MPYIMYAIVSTIADDPVDEERRIAEIKERLGPDYTVHGGVEVPDAPAA